MSVCIRVSNIQNKQYIGDMRLINKAVKQRLKDKFQQSADIGKYTQVHKHKIFKLTFAQKSTGQEYFITRILEVVLNF